ncbi:hypothetical protein N0V85_004826 [Neurospora sp. IMI 360204]|nr:hypothetical protein N0V85_004826 [Neurospora sp. IMI 360204]
MRNAKTKALTQLKAFTTMEMSGSASPTPLPEKRNSVDPDTDKGTVTHENEATIIDEATVINENTVINEDTVMGEDTVIDEDADTDTDIDTSTNRIRFDKRRTSPNPPRIEKLSSSEHGLQVPKKEETLYFVFQNVRFPCKPGKYRVLFDVVVNDYRNEQDRKFPHEDLWLEGEYPGEEEMARSYGCGYQAGVLEFKHELEVKCRSNWTRAMAGHYLNWKQYDYIEGLFRVGALYTPKRWREERAGLASLRKQKHYQTQIIQAHIQVQARLTLPNQYLSAVEPSPSDAYDSSPEE